MINTISHNFITFRSDATSTSQTNVAENISSNNLPKTEKLQKRKSQHPYRTLGIIFAGATAMLYALGVGVRYKNRTNITELTKGLSETFRKELTENEAKEIAEQYKEIFKINNAKDFIKKAYEQIKKDYGYEQADIPIEIEYFGKYYFIKHPFKKFSMGGFENIENKIKINTCCDNGGTISKAEKKFVFETIFHELKHMEQAHLCFLKDKNKFFDAISKYNSENERKLNMFEQSSLRLALERNYKKAYENVPIKDVSKYNTIIDKYIENTANYQTLKRGKKKEYLEQILEKDALKAQKAGCKFLWLDKPLFYLPNEAIPYILLGISAGCFSKDRYDTFEKNR